MQRHIVQRIIDRGNDYLITVKGNQPTLHETIEAYCASNAPLSTDCDVDCSHGRSVERTVSVWTAPRRDTEHALDAAWAGVRHIIRVERSGRRDGHDFSECMYYITSRREPSARTLGRLVRQHWQIENCLHWVKDVIYREDASGIRGDNAAPNMALITTIALNIFRLNGWSSIKYGIIASQGNIDVLKKLVRT